MKKREKFLLSPASKTGDFRTVSPHSKHWKEGAGKQCAECALSCNLKVLVTAIRVILLVIRVILRPNSKQWFTTSFLGRRCRKAMLGVCSLVSFKCGGSNNTSDTIGDTSDTVGNTSDNYGYYVSSAALLISRRDRGSFPCLSDTAHHFPFQTVYFWFGFDCRTGYDSAFFSVCVRVRRGGEVGIGKEVITCVYCLFLLVFM